MKYLVSDFTTEQLDATKQILFGLQKQANTINQVVVAMVAAAITSVKGDTSILQSPEGVKTAIKEYLQGCIDGTIIPDDTTMLIIGIDGMNKLKANGPKVVVVDQPNPESPKVTFRIAMLGEPTQSATVSADVTMRGPQITPSSVGTHDSSIKEDNFRTRVEDLKTKILPLVPEAVKLEIPDEYQQCLCCAEYFYNL